MGKRFFFEGKIDGKIIFEQKAKTVLDMTQYLYPMGIKKLLQN